MKAAALVQLYGGDGMGMLQSSDPVAIAVQFAVARAADELQAERYKDLARMIRNEVAEMLNEK